MIGCASVTSATGSPQAATWARRLMPARHRFHEQCQRVFETFGPRRVTLVVSQTDDDQVMRRNDQRVLASDTGHVVGALGQGEQAVSIDPEEPAIDRTMIGGPSRSHSGHELHE